MTTARDELRGVVGNVLVNASNFPAKAAPHLLGRDMGPLIDKTADELILAGYVKPTGTTTVSQQCDFGGVAGWGPCQKVDCTNPRRTVTTTIMTETR
ncbi:hypothetical protein D6T64_11950 [Cryobacterium melibiosiphilum]|uniref:Uncharacterized protein n=1 Tax=Cryobacterium melibiosiphilum TaxID=995039 RepID=A0A3A5MPV1_9MICO|nr:hypothetical protein [Cryobacterium melibiosiphilum]RJT88096.1 hypothetical protein D6T64_11950 [Cryobacterium melibiosiphilum]